MHKGLEGGAAKGGRRGEEGAEDARRPGLTFSFRLSPSLPSHHPSRPARPPPPALDRYRVDCCLTPPRDPHTSHRSAPRVRPFSSPLPLFFISSHLIAMRSLVVAAVLAGAASLASAASTSVMLYRHANIDKVTSRAARNVAVSLMGGSDTQKKERGVRAGLACLAARGRRAGVHTGGRAQGASTPHQPAVHPVLGLGHASFFHRRRELGRAGPGRPSAGGGHLSPMGRSKGERARQARAHRPDPSASPRARARELPSPPALTARACQGPPRLWPHGARSCLRPM